MLISLSRVQGCSGRGETPARCSCSACLGPRGSPLHPPSCYLPLKMSELTNMLQLDMGGAVKLWHVYCRFCQCCYQQQMSCIDQHYDPPTCYDADMNIEGFFPFKPASTNNHWFWRQRASVKHQHVDTRKWLVIQEICRKYITVTGDHFVLLSIFPVQFKTLVSLLPLLQRINSHCYHPMKSTSGKTNS